jgi:hypothetical protein
VAETIAPGTRGVVRVTFEAACERRALRKGESSGKWSPGNVEGRDFVRRTFHGYALAAVPGLVLHRTCFSADRPPHGIEGTSWTISHAPSGYALMKIIPGLALAWEALRDLGACGDWTRSAAEIHADEPMRFAGRGVIARVLAIAEAAGEVALV